MNNAGPATLRPRPSPIEHTLTLCEGVTAAEAIRDRVNAMQSGRIALGFGGNPNEPSAMRGGPMFELLFGLDTLLRRQRKRDRIELTFFNAATEPGKRLGEGGHRCWPRWRNAASTPTWPTCPSASPRRAWTPRAAM